MINKLYLIPMSAVLALSSQVILAASECKGLDQTACAANTACTWASGYVRKDGKEIAPYCKSKGQKKGAEEGGAPAVKAPAGESSPK